MATAVKQRPRSMIAFRGRAPGSVKALYSISHSAQERAPVLSGTVELAKDLLSNLLKVQVPGRGYIHIPVDPARGFDDHWSAEMTAEKKAVKYRAGQRIAIWEKRPGARNEAWDLMTMTLILAESMQLNMENREPDYYSENVAPSGASTLKFGVQNLAQWRSIPRCSSATLSPPIPMFSIRTTTSFIGRLGAHRITRSPGNHAFAKLPSRLTGSGARFLASGNVVTSFPSAISRVGQCSNHGWVAYACFTMFVLLVAEEPMMGRGLVSRPHDIRVFTT
jgi:hypothetical protein